MYARIALVAAVLAVTPLAHAGESVTALARETGLSERNIRMLLVARTPYPEHRAIFDKVDRQFEDAVGEVRYERLTGRQASPARPDRADTTGVAARKQDAKDTVAAL
jgi:hypothetical protein